MRCPAPTGALDQPQAQVFRAAREGLLDRGTVTCVVAPHQPGDRVRSDGLFPKVRAGPVPLLLQGLVDRLETAEQVQIEQLLPGGFCYFSAGSWEDFRSDASTFPLVVRGNVYSGFPDERWLDIRSDTVLTLMNARLDLARQKGCDGVEADNVDGLGNDTGFPLTAADQLGFNRRLFNGAHERGLAVALKNDGDQAAALIDYVDLSVNERCHELGECGQLEGFITAGKPVLNAEYLSEYVSDSGARDAMCGQARGRAFRTLVLPEDLDDSFRFSCDDSS